MNSVAKILIGLVGLFSITMGLVGLFAPGIMAEIMGFKNPSTLGIHSIRGDIATIFLAAAFGCYKAFFMGKIEFLRLPILLYGLVLFGRCVGTLFSGMAEGTVQPMIVEVILVGTLVFAYRTLRTA